MKWKKFVWSGLFMLITWAFLHYYYYNHHHLLPPFLTTNLIQPQSPNPQQNQDPNPTRQNSIQPPTGKLLCHPFSARMGNQMLQYVAVLGLARKLNRTPVFTIRNTTEPYLYHVLKIPPRNATPEEVERCENSVHLMEEACCRFDESFLNLDPEKDYQVERFLQSWKYFEGFEEEMIQAVRFQDSILQEASRTVEGLRSKYEGTLLIGVHVRRGDLLLKGLIRKGFITAPATFYRNAMNYMRRRFGRKTTFIVSVDDADWFRDSVTSDSDVVVKTLQAPAVDLMVLTSLDHVIISTGTFSWWVGFLNAGVTVYWKDFISPGTVIGNEFDPDGSTFVYPRFIPIS